MDDNGTAAHSAHQGYRDLFRDGRGAFTMLVILGAALHALQTLVIAIIMPTVVADIGGAEFYTWAAMSFTIGAIIGAASVGPVWNALGRRRGYALSTLAFMAGTAGCALAGDMATLIAARTLQGYAGGLVTGGSMALVGALFTPALRTRVLALYQGTFTCSHLMGPLVGGSFAAMGWWRGSFWSLVPVMVCFALLAWWKIPDRIEGEPEPGQAGFPVARLALLASGVLCVAAAGPADDNALRLALVIVGVVLVWLTFRVDAGADNRLYPSGALSVRAPVGLALWILFIVGAVQTALTLFLPLLLQVVHGVNPVFINFVTIAISFGWTVGTFAVSGWTGSRERFALWIGPVLMFGGMAGITLTAQLPLLWVLTVSAFVFGVGIGTHNVHLYARTMAGAPSGQERITASAMPSIRSFGTAVGAAVAGMLSVIAGLGDATEAGAVGDAVTVVYSVNLIPLAMAVLFMLMLVRMGDRAVPAGGRAPSEA